MTVNINCPECGPQGGTGSLTLLASVVPCRTCSGTEPQKDNPWFYKDLGDNAAREATRAAFGGTCVRDHRARLERSMLLHDAAEAHAGDAPEAGPWRTMMDLLRQGAGGEKELGKFYKDLYGNAGVEAPAADSPPATYTDRPSLYRSIMLSYGPCLDEHGRVLCMQRNTHEVDVAYRKRLLRRLVVPPRKAAVRVAAVNTVHDQITIKNRHTPDDALMRALTAGGDQ